LFREVFGEWLDYNDAASKALSKKYGKGLETFGDWNSDRVVTGKGTIRGRRQAVSKPRLSF
jgi:hypothetical protein